MKNKIIIKYYLTFDENSSIINIGNEIAEMRLPNIIQ